MTRRERVRGSQGAEAGDHRPWAQGLHQSIEGDSGVERSVISISFGGCKKSSAKLGRTGGLHALHIIS